MEGDWRKSKPSLTQAVSHAFETGLYSDLTFRVGPKLHVKFTAHKFVVMSRSEVFAVMFHDRWNASGDSKDSNRNFVDIPHSDPKSFGRFLKYLYTDDLEDRMPVEAALEVLRLADMYQVQGLVSKSCALLTSKINLETCVQIFQATRIYSDQGIQLSKSAFDFVKRHIKSALFSPSFLDFDEDGLMQLLKCDDLEVGETALFNAVLKWSKHEECFGEEAPVLITGNNSNNSKTNRKIQLNSLIPLIRFPLMGPEKFTSVVVPSKVLSDKTVIDIFVHFNGGRVDDLKFSTKPRHQSIPRIFQGALTTLPCNFKLIKCYDRETQYRLAVVEFGCSIYFQSQQDLSFLVSTPIIIQGLRFYGLRRDKVPVDPSRMMIDYESLDVKIYKYSPRQAEYLAGKNESGLVTVRQVTLSPDASHERKSVNIKEIVAAQKWNKVRAPNGSEFNLLFDEPTRIISGVEYFIEVSLDVNPILTLPSGVRVHTPEYTYSIGDFVQQPRQVSVNPLTMTLQIVNSSQKTGTSGTETGNQASGMIHSIIYT